YGDAGSDFVSGLAGKNFADGRGNVALNFEFARQNTLYASERDYASRNNGFVAVDTEAFDTNVVNGSDGNPDNILFQDIRSATINSGGLIAFASPTGLCGRDNQTQGSFVGRPFTCNYIFDSNGNLVPQTGTRVGLSSIANNTTATATPGGAFIGGNGNTRREGTLIQLQPGTQRYALNLIGHFDVSELFKPFVEAKFVRTEAFGQGGSGPAFFTGSTLDAFYERPRFDNPYLSAQAQGVIQAARAAAGLAPATGATRLVLRRNLTDLGSRTEDSTRDTYRIVVGAKGTISDSLRYEISANYGEFRESTTIKGNLNIQRFLLGIDAIRNSSGQIVCGSQVDPTRAGADFGGNPARLAADIAACQPINPFGEGNISQAAKNYVLQDTVSRSHIKQFDATGFVSGDTEHFFKLPGGPVGFAAGFEYRRENVGYTQDPLVSAGYTFYNSIADFSGPTFEVAEGYGEIRAPILKDLPFAKELTISGAARFSSYAGSAGSVWAYNGGIDYAPVQDVRFRFAYSRSVRAPNLSDLYFPASQNFAGAFTDPCALNNINSGSQFRVNNCRNGAGIPNTFNYIYAQSLEFVSGGNIAGGGAGLRPEVSDSYTYGLVLEPRWIPGLTASVDYYDINVKDVITSPSAQAIVNACYDSPTTVNQFCSLFQRSGAAATDPYRIVEGSLLSIPLNYAGLRTRGIDAELNYSHKLGGTAKISTSIIYTHVFENTSFLDPTQPGFGNTFIGEVGDPRDQFNWNIDVTSEHVFVNYQLRYIGRQSVGTYEALNSFQGRAPENADFSTPAYYPAVVYMNLRAGVKVGKGSQFYVGVDNLANQLPPLGSTGIGGGTAIFDNIGRRLYAGFTAKF
ncbi:MAG: TonB-dependent receptor, partial [Sphingomonas sp.]|nr:TonB-dependent receptor [Sphingomonas sp.]